MLIKVTNHTTMYWLPTHYWVSAFLLELRYCQQTIKDLLLKVAEQYTFYKKGSHKLWCIHSYMHIIRSTILSSKVNSLLYYKIIWRHMRFLFNYLFCDFKMRMQDKFLHQHYFQYNITMILLLPTDRMIKMLTWKCIMECYISKW